MGVERQHHQKEEKPDQSVVGRHLEDFVVDELGLGFGRVERFFPVEAAVEIGSAAPGPKQWRLVDLGDT